jgi:hypothetical protein
MLRLDREPLQDGFGRFSCCLVQLAQQQLGYDVQAGHEVTQAIGVYRREGCASSAGESWLAVRSPMASSMALAMTSPGAVR